MDGLAKTGINNIQMSIAELMRTILKMDLVTIITAETPMTKKMLGAIQLMVTDGTTVIFLLTMVLQSNMTTEASNHRPLKGTHAKTGVNRHQMAIPEPQRNTQTQDLEITTTAEIQMENLTESGATQLMVQDGLIANQKQMKENGTDLSS